MLNLKNKKLLLLIAVAILLVLGLSVANATNITKTDTNKVSKKVSVTSSSNAIKDKSIDKKVVKNTSKNDLKTAASKTKTKLTISNVKKQYEVKDQLQVKVKLIDNKNKALKNQYLTVKVNKNSFKVKTDKKGVATTKKITLNNVGKYTISANFAGTKKYASSKVTKTTKSTKRSTKIVAENYLEYSEYQHENITFFLSNKKGKKINKKSSIDVIINNKNKKIKMEKGRIVLTLNNSKLNGVKLNNGTNNLTFKYSGDKTTKKVVKKYKFIINRTQPEIDLHVPDTILYGTKNHFYPILNRKGNNFNVVIDGRIYNCKEEYWGEYEGDDDESGDSAMYFANKLGKHTIYVKFAGNYEYAPTKTDVSYFNVVRAPSVLSLDLKNKNNVNETMYIKANLEYKEARWGQYYPTGEVINFTINNKTYQRKTVNGTATLKYTPKKVGNYTIKIKLNTSDSKNVTLNKTNKKFVVGKNIVKKATKFEVKYNKDIIKGRSQTINITLLYKPNQYLDLWKTVKNAKIVVETKSTEKEYKTNKKGQISIENQGENLSITYKGNSLLSKKQKQIKRTVHDKVKFNTSIEYVVSYYDDDFDNEGLVELELNSLDKIFRGDGIFDALSGDNNYIKINFLNNEGFILNSTTVDLYLDDVFIGSKSVENNTCRYYVYDIFDKTYKQYYDMKHVDDEWEDIYYVDKENNKTYTDSKIYEALLSKFTHIKFVINNDDVSNFTITHLINQTSNQNTINQSFETKNVL